MRSILYVLGQFKVPNQKIARGTDTVGARIHIGCRCSPRPNRSQPATTIELANEEQQALLGRSRNSRSRRVIEALRRIAEKLWGDEEARRKR
jgi:hypothetical protein